MLVQAADGRRRRYRVAAARVVDYRRPGIVLDQSRARLAMVTCYPFDAIVPGGPLRYVVTAEAVADAPAG